METLSLIDQALHKVTASGLASMYMQGASILDPSKAPFRVDADVLAEHLAARLNQVPILRKRLVQDPLRMGSMRLVDDPDFDVWNHITFATLPAPGGITELTRYLGRFSSQPLDFDRPLWRFEVIDGLEGGRLAMAQKLSHATMDGLAAARLMGCINDTEPRRPDKYQPRDWSPEPDPSRLQLLGGAVRENTDRFARKLPRVSAKLLKMGAQSLVSGVSQRHEEAGDPSRAALKIPSGVPHTSLGNREISPDKRNIAFAVFELSKLKAICRRLDCTLNDLCLLMVSESLASYFRGVGEHIDFDLVAAMPLDMRQASDREYGNELNVATINLHSTIPALDKRLRAIEAETRQAKNARRGEEKASPSVASDVMSLVPPMTLDILCYALKALKPWESLPLPCHTVFTNVPGPRGEIYVAGMPVETPIPMIPLISPGALSIGGCSHGDHFSFGFQACGKAIREEDMHFLVDGLQSAYRQLNRKPRTGARKSAPKRKK